MPRIFTQQLKALPPGGTLAAPASTTRRQLAAIVAGDTALEIIEAIDGGLVVRRRRVVKITPAPRPRRSPKPRQPKATKPRKPRAVREVVDVPAPVQVGDVVSLTTRPGAPDAPTFEGVVAAAVELCRAVEIPLHDVEPVIPAELRPLPESAPREPRIWVDEPQPFVPYDAAADAPSPPPMPKATNLLRSHA